MTPADYPVVMAVEDFLPVMLAFAGFWLLAPDRVGRVGAVLLGLGGLCKASWKLLVAAWGVDLPWLEAALFPLMALGGLLLAGALHRQLGLPWWPYPVAGGIAVAAIVFTGSLQPAFILATLLVVIISALGAIFAWRHGNVLAAVLYPISIIAVTALVPLRNAAGAETVSHQWIQQATNTIAQAVFFAAALLTVLAVQKGRTDD